MSNNSFRVKNSLNLNPQDLTTIVNPSQGDVACDINDQGKIKFFDSASSTWKEMGGASPSLDTAFQLTCEEDLSDWDNSALMGGTFVKETANPLNGDASYKFTRSTSASTAIIVSPAQPVALRFRGQTCTLTFPYTYDGLNDIASVSLYDNTNNTSIEGSLKLQGTNGGVKNASLTVTVPLTCESVDVVFRFDGADNSKVLQFDDIQLSTANIFADLNNMTDNISYVPVITTASGSMTNYTATGEWHRDGIEIVVNAKITFTGASGTWAEPSFSLPNGLSGDVEVLKIGANGFKQVGDSSFEDAGVKNFPGGTFFSHSAPTKVTAIPFSANEALVGQAQANSMSPFSFDTVDTITVSFRLPILGWSAHSPNIVLANETFSTDTAALRYAPASEYTFATLANAPVGTYITYAYAASSNTPIQTTGTDRPTQTDADMNANGIRVYARTSYIAGTTYQNPADIAVQVGKDFKGWESFLFDPATNINTFSQDFILPDSTIQYGPRQISYNPNTGVLYVNCGTAERSTLTTGLFTGSGASNTSAYLKFNASKSPALSGVGVKTIAARATSSSGQGIPNDAITILTWDAVKSFDTTNSLNPATGTYAVPENGIYNVCAIVSYPPAVSTVGSEYNISVFVNGAVHTLLQRCPVYSNANVGFSVGGSASLQLKEGDLVTLRVYQNSGGAKALVVSGVNNVFSIAKINIG